MDDTTNTTEKTLWDKICDGVSGFFETVWEAIKPGVNKAQEVMVSMFSAAIHEGAEQLGEQGGKIVAAAVEAAEKTGGTGDEKWEAAKAQAHSELAAAGITAAARVVNAALEAAVVKLAS